MKIEKEEKDIYYRERVCTKALRLKQVGDLGKLQEAGIWSLGLSLRWVPWNEGRRVSQGTLESRKSFNFIVSWIGAYRRVREDAMKKCTPLRGSLWSCLPWKGLWAKGQGYRVLGQVQVAGRNCAYLCSQFIIFFFYAISLDKASSLVGQRL